MTVKPKFGRGPRLKVEVRQPKGWFNNKFRVYISNCEPSEYVNILLTDSKKGLIDSIQAQADSDGYIDVQVDWKLENGKNRIFAQSLAKSEDSTEGFY
jgi:hypothetical protein